VKSIESRYIDLANFYKAALVKKDKNDNEDNEQNLLKMATSEPVLASTVEIEESTGMQRTETDRENQMILELMSDKKQLEEHIDYMKNTISRHTGNTDSVGIDKTELSHLLVEVF
jgi:hypothetical protein